MSVASGSDNLSQVLPGPAKPKAFVPSEPEQGPAKRQKQLPPCDSELAQRVSGGFEWAFTESIMMEWYVDEIGQLVEDNRYEHARDKCKDLHELLSSVWL
jgi:hypothetical protein